MPRCQRTFRRLPVPLGGNAAVRSPVTRWICPHCPDSEVYEAVGEADLLQYSRLAEAACIQDFGPPADAGRATYLISGLRPECVLEAQDRRYDIYLQRGSDALQLRLQIGHELFHRTCSHGRIFHWTHEMLACLFSVRLLRRQGFEEYACQMSDHYLREAEACTAETFFAADLWALADYPPGYYGRAYALGQALKAAVGWQTLCRLARFPPKIEGQPDVEGWLRTMTAGEQTEAALVLKAGTAPNPRDRQMGGTKVH